MEKLGKAEAALEAYRTSLNLDPKQNKLLLKSKCIYFWISVELITLGVNEGIEQLTVCVAKVPATLFVFCAGHVLNEEGEYDYYLKMW